MKRLFPLLALPLLAHAPLLACAGGVYGGILADPAGALAAPPETAFRIEIARIAGEPEFRFTGVDEDQALVDGLDALLRRQNTGEAEREKALFAYAEYRLALAAPQSKQAGVFARPGKTPELRREGEAEYGEKSERAWTVPPTPRLPRAFALYEEGAKAWRERLAKERAKAFASDPVAGDEALKPCAKAWTALLALPEGDRREITVFARFMLAKAALADSGKRAARESVEAVREAVRKGFPDTTGLAAATYQMDKHLARDDWEGAEALLRVVAAGGPEWQWRELRAKLTGILLAERGPSGAKLAAEHPRVREAVAAMLTSTGVPGKKESDWPAFIEATQKEFPEAALLAAAAYRDGEYAAAQRWSDRAKPDEPLAALVASRLLLRQGLVDKAAERLAAAVPETGALYRADFAEARKSSSRIMAASDWLPFQGLWDRDLAAVECPSIAAPFTIDPPWESGQPTHAAMRDPLALRAMAAGELAALRLAGDRPAEALALFLRCAHWRDAARVAERHMTTAALIAFVEKLPAKDSPAGENGITPEGYLRYIAGRRLCREARFAEAEAYFPESAKPVLREYVKTMKAAFDLTRADRERALDMLAAARILAKSGELIFLSVTGPRIRDSRVEDPDAAVSAPRPDEPKADAKIARVPVETPAPAESIRLPALRDRVMRIRAFDLAFGAASLLPNDDPVAAETYWKLGRWQARRYDSARAGLCYEALVLRCPRTALGQKALALKKLPPLPEEERNEYERLNGF